MTTGLLDIAEKIELARVQTALPAIDAAAADRETLSSWLDAHVRHERVRDLLRTIVRVTTFTNDPERQSAGAALAQLQLGLKGVLYLDGGWQTIVEGLRRTALAAGARIVTTSPAVGLERHNAREVTAVRLADGTAVRASAVVIAAGPDDVDAISGQTRLASTLPSPVRIATLDVALRSLPRPKQTVAFGVDTPLYFSVHSALARLAPQAGALIHVSKYLRPDENAGREVEQELERLMDDMQPGWRDRVEARHYLPSLMVTHAEVTAARRAGLAAVLRRGSRHSTTCSSLATGSDRAGSCRTRQRQARQMRHGSRPKRQAMRRSALARRSKSHEQHRAAVCGSPEIPVEPFIQDDRERGRRGRRRAGHVRPRDGASAAAHGGSTAPVARQGRPQSLPRRAPPPQAA